MKFIPILLSTEMVEAEQAGRKTKTRRTKGLEQINTMPDQWKFLGLYHRDLSLKKLRVYCAQFKEKAGFIHNIPCPYGQPGDILWVRETFAPTVNIIPSGYWYKAKADEMARQMITWKPAIHMPKIACRTFLQIIDINVERLHEITEADAIAEGVQENICENPLECISSLCKNGCIGKGEYFNYPVGMAEGDPCNSAVESFETLWVYINGTESWNENPWVWVISFKRIDKPNNFLS